MSQARLIYIVGLLALAAPAPLAAQSTQNTRIHVVQPGESCWSIAQQVFGKGEKYRIIHRYNDLGPLPHILKAGQKLRLPVGGAVPTAKVSWLRKEVLAKAPPRLAGRAATRDMGLCKL